ncbi:hypothetical protein BJF87_07680 [Gordonia sp. CNJ-863]|uniref:hypothetical protein n=1 Tax=Gordonia sp. CNJ-863 TaxID=1904963 RepID=UPI0009616E3E|nr:hypothetical protein [Gordonia sp. CNJ-863]OLT44466.1 hypothetical protein BJF87_07680 [Gordonia sp. CNJ-863]
MTTTHSSLTRSLPARKKLFIFGGDPNAVGTSTQGDVLVNQTADGVDLNRIWDEAATAMQAWNKSRTSLAAILSYPTTNVGDAIAQSIGGDHFEEASEFGEPTGLRAEPDALILGYSLSDFDLASRFSWRFLRSATAQQVKSVIDRALEADNRLVTGAILRRLFDPAEKINEVGHRCYGLYNGDGTVPPSFAGQTFSGSSSHYLISGNANGIDPGDITDLIKQVRSKGFGTTPNSKLLILANPLQGEIIASFRAGVETNGVESQFDFIPARNAPAYLTPNEIVGEQAPGEWSNLPISGSYGPAWLVESRYLPVGYVAVVATGGPNSTINPIGFRQHQNPAYQGLRLLPGSDSRYPLVSSFMQRSFGVGTRYRGAAAVVQVKASGPYEAPEWAWT